MARRQNQKPKIYNPKLCWVGDVQKICYDTQEEAELAAGVAEYDHRIHGLSVYKCDFGDHWHLSSS